MKERPIPFSAPLVRAILAGQKTQTRRVVKPIPDFVAGNGSIVARFTPDDQKLGRLGETIKCPYGQPGDRLWVKETTLKVEDHGYIGPVYAESDEGRACLDGGIALSEDDYAEVEPREIKRRPSIFMPRAMARILLEVVSVRVERLQDISEADAFDEGIIQQKTTGWFSVPGINGAGTTARAAYALLWNSINGANSWNKNPWVWVVEFKQIQPTKGGG